MRRALLCVAMLLVAVSGTQRVNDLFTGRPMSVLDTVAAIAAIVGAVVALALLLIQWVQFVTRGDDLQHTFEAMVFPEADYRYERADAEKSLLVKRELNYDVFEFRVAVRVRYGLEVERFNIRPLTSSGTNDRSGRVSVTKVWDRELEIRNMTRLARITKNQPAVTAELTTTEDPEDSEKHGMWGFFRPPRKYTAGSYLLFRIEVLAFAPWDGLLSFRAADKTGQDRFVRAPLRVIWQPQLPPASPTPSPTSQSGGKNLFATAAQLPEHILHPRHHPLALESVKEPRVGKLRRNSLYRRNATCFPQRGVVVQRPDKRGKGRQVQERLYDVGTPKHTVAVPYATGVIGLQGTDKLIFRDAIQKRFQFIYTGSLPCSKLKSAETLSQGTLSALPLGLLQGESAEWAKKARCGGRDSNSHTLTGAVVTARCVYQFRHPRLDDERGTPACKLRVPLSCLILGFEFVQPPTYALVASTLRSATQDVGGDTCQVLYTEEEMSDLYDIRMRKMEMVWELANRVIPKEPQSSGPWTADTYLAKTQETLKAAQAIIEAVFKGGKAATDT